MRIHTDGISIDDIRDAARKARVDVVTLTVHGSRSRDIAYNIKLEGESRRRPNGGQSGAGSGYAATWDQWGVFLAILFDIDAAGRDTVTPYYRSREDFHQRTNWRFEARLTERRDDDGDRIATHWPEDAHGDHTFRFAGVPREQSCTKCSAVQRW